MSRTIPLLIGIKIHRAWNLPKMDLFGTIDPYVIVEVEGDRTKTQVIQNNPKPIWEEALTLRAEVKAGQIPVHFQLWDKDALSDDAVSWKSIWLGDAERASLVMNMAKGVDPVAQGYPTVEFSMSYHLDYKGLCERLQSQAGVIFDDAHQSVVVPLDQIRPSLYLMLTYKEGGKMDFRIVSTALLPSDVAYHWSWKHRDGIVIKRRKSLHPFRVGALSVYNECLVEDIGAHESLEHLELEVIELQHEESFDLASVAHAYGLRPGMRFKEAMRTIRDARFSPEEQKLYFPLSRHLIEEDFDHSEVRIYLYDTLENKRYLYHQLVDAREYGSKTYEAFFEKPRVIQKFRICGVMGLMDIDGEVQRHHYQMHIYKRRQTQRYAVTDLVPIKPIFE